MLSDGGWESAQFRDLRAELQRNPALARQAEQAFSPKGPGWPDPKPLSGELPPVAPFELALLPKALRAWVADIAERMQTPLDFPAASAVVALAGCVNRRAMIQPKAHDSTWVVVPNLWGAIIGPPGVMKSPVVSTVVAPLERIEKGWRETYEVELEAYQSEAESHKLELAAWGELVKRAFKKSGERPQKPMPHAEKPTQRRLMLNDATFESLHTLLAANPLGLFLVRDELTGWLAALDRQGREGERAFCSNAGTVITHSR